MRVMKWSMIALAVSAAGSQLAMAEPFVTPSLMPRVSLMVLRLVWFLRTTISTGPSSLWVAMTRKTGAKVYWAKPALAIPKVP